MRDPFRNYDQWKTAEPPYPEDEEEPENDYGEDQEGEPEYEGDDYYKTLDDADLDAIIEPPPMRRPRGEPPTADEEAAVRFIGLAFCAGIIIGTVVLMFRV